MINFYKYQGAGNDFVMIDNRNLRIKPDNKIKLVKQLCERRFGVGSDGLIFIENHDELDFVMDFYNPDGSQSFCGNGSRCAVAFAQFIGVFEGDVTHFLAIDGQHTAEIKDGLFKVSMQDVQGIDRVGEDYFINTGSPHYISYENGSEERDIVIYGRSIRYSDDYAPNGTNVNLVKIIETDEIQVRTYERGVEAETFACGTGATACALSYVDQVSRPAGVVKVRVKGGDLWVYYQLSAGTYKNIWLEGPAKQVFHGAIE